MAQAQGDVQAVPVICIGFSAGGLGPLRAILRQLGPNTGAAFVVIPHLQRERATQLPWLLSSWSPMTSELAEDGRRFRPNHIYVILPGQEIAITDGRFAVRPRSKRTGWSNVITVFLNSLVRSRNHPGIAVILSGMDADGAAALAAFHRMGGVTIVQDPRSANHKEMPQSAINTGFVDYVLPAEAIASKVEQIINRVSETKV
jgi:chemotaxis response regulator CheB